MAGLVALTVVLPPPARRRQAYLVLGFVAGFLLFVTLASKKLDRYALPIFPSLALLAGLGLWSVYEELGSRLAGAGRAARRWLVAGLVGVAGAGQALTLLSVAPYPLSFYNPVIGGGPAAERVMLVGWGEGLDRVADYLNAQPDAATSRIAIYYPLVLNFQGMVTGTLHRFGDRVLTDYVVDYVNASQRGQLPQEVYGKTPEYTVEMNGIVYARVFRLDPPRVLSTAGQSPPAE
jgi:4-amino-4-deoxy-L-arabinose transferase-like glycosyltransferase